MALPHGIPPPIKETSTAAVCNLRPLTKGNEISRRCLLPLLISTAAIPEVRESKKTLLQEYLNRSKENKERNDKERLDDFYKRNYKDYFGFIEGSIKDKKEELLSESEKGILEWLRKNKN